MPRPLQLAARRALRLARGEAVPVRGAQRLLQHRRELAAVIGAGGRRLVGELLRLDVVEPAQLDRVPPGLARRLLQQPLHVVIALRPAGAAIGRDGRGVGQDGARVHLDQRRRVVALDVLDVIAGRHQRPHGGDVGAEIGEGGEPHRERAPFRVEREFRLHLVVAAVLVGHEASRAVVRPLHRPAEHLRRVQQAGVLGIGVRLHAEGAADIAGQHPELLGRHLQHVLRHLPAQPEDALAADMERPAVGGGVVLADGAARLHGADHDAVVADRHAGDVRGAREGLFHLGGVAVVEIEHLVARDVVVEQRRAGLGGGRGLGDGGKRVHVEEHRLGPVARRRPGLGDHEGHRVAHEAHLVEGQGRPLDVADRRAVAVLHRQDAGHGAETRRLEIGARSTRRPRQAPPAPPRSRCRG